MGLYIEFNIFHMDDGLSFCVVFGIFSSVFLCFGCIALVVCLPSAKIRYVINVGYSFVTC